MHTLRQAIILDEQVINENPLVKYNNEMIIVSIGGLLLNIVGLFLFQQEEQEKNANIYAQFLHVLADTLGSIGVIAAAFLIRNY